MNTKHTHRCWIEGCNEPAYCYRRGVCARLVAYCKRHKPLPVEKPEPDFNWMETNNQRRKTWELDEVR